MFSRLFDSREIRSNTMENTLGLHYRGYVRNKI
jgi:hypothetical protein